MRTITIAIFCREQWKIIYSVTMDKKDNMAIMSTGEVQFNEFYQYVCVTMC